MGVVYAQQSASVSYSEGKVFVRKGQAWDSDALLVRERPELFSDEPAKVAGRPRRRGDGPPVIERATRAPGETRPAPAKKAAPKAKTGDSAGE
jgi:hypothetical protein